MTVRIVGERYILESGDQRRGGTAEVFNARDHQTSEAVFGRYKFTPWGLSAGHDGSPNSISVIRKDGRLEGQFYKLAPLLLGKGEVVRLVTATGGAYGDPSRRPAERVERDVRDGYITPEQAHRFYGPHSREGQ